MNKRLHLIGIAIAFALLAIQFTPATAGPDAPKVAENFGTGRLDPAYGSGGKIITALGENTPAALQPDGGIAWLEPGELFRLHRLDTAGNFDVDFEQSATTVQAVVIDNWMEYDIPRYEYGATGLAVLPDGRIVALGYVRVTVGVSPSHVGEIGNLVLWRASPGGVLDPTFGAQYPYLANRHASGGVLGLQPDGKILVAGRSYFNECHGCFPGYDPRYEESFALARFVDGGGRDMPDLDDPSLGDMLQLAGQYDGKILVRSNNSIRRYQGNQLDPTFDHDGELTFFNPIRAMLSLPNGKLLTAQSNSDFEINQNLPDGSPDSSFGNGGSVVYGLDTDDIPAALAVQPDGKILVAGSLGPSAWILRLMPDGSLDPTFGFSGALNSMNVNFGADFRATEVRALADGKIGLLGVSDGHVVAARLLGDNCTPEFHDVPADSYYHLPVQYLYCVGALSGYGDGTFGGERNTTRAQLAKIVVLANDMFQFSPPFARFSDVPVSNPFYSYVETAARAGMISGYANGTFRPYNNITRGQLSKVITLQKGWQLLRPQQPTFADVDADNPFYRYIETAYSHGIISGYDLPDGGREFRWGNNATRAQVAKIVYKTITASADAAK